MGSCKRPKEEWHCPRSTPLMIIVLNVFTVLGLDRQGPVASVWWEHRWRRRPGFLQHFWTLPGSECLVRKQFWLLLFALQRCAFANRSRRPEFSSFSSFPIDIADGCIECDVSRPLDYATIFSWWNLCLDQSWSAISQAWPQKKAQLLNGPEHLSSNLKSQQFLAESEADLNGHSD